MDDAKRKQVSHEIRGNHPSNPSRPLALDCGAQSTARIQLPRSLYRASENGLPNFLRRSASARASSRAHGGSSVATSFRVITSTFFISVCLNRNAIIPCIIERMDSTISTLAPMVANVPFSTAIIGCTTFDSLTDCIAVACQQFFVLFLLVHHSTSVSASVSTPANFSPEKISRP